MRTGILALALVGVISVKATARAADCAGLRAHLFPHTEITDAVAISPGALNAQEPKSPLSALFRELPAFCRIVGILRPTSDSAIGFEVWLPEKWNGRYLQVGNAGFAVGINHREMIPGLRNGFATASTDDGHTGVRDAADAAWALGHPEKIVDFGYRAVHLTSVTAKQMVSVYYRQRSFRAYFSGCSGGGRESLMEAQRYPRDFDGWVVGAPANDLTGFMTYLLHLAQSTAALKEPLQPTQIEALSKGALASCDRADGVRDGVIDEPARCAFDASSLACQKVADGPCLSKAQVEYVRKIYDDARDEQTLVGLAPGLRGVLGSEADQWRRWVGPVPHGSGLSSPRSQSYSENFWPFMVYHDPEVDFRTLDLPQAAIDARARTGAMLNAIDPDLSAVRAGGKKIIQYHGWADPAIPAQYSINYYESVENYLGGDIRDFYRLFLAPGMGHCGEGPGPNAFGGTLDPHLFGASHDPRRGFDPENDVLAAVVSWVEKGKAPERIIATKYRDDQVRKGVVRTRPLCPYPSTARWIGKGAPMRPTASCAPRASTRRPGYIASLAMSAKSTRAIFSTTSPTRGLRPDELAR